MFENMLHNANNCFSNLYEAGYHSCDKWMMTEFILSVFTVIALAWVLMAFAEKAKKK